MQSKIFGLSDDRLPVVSTGSLVLNEYYWDVYPNNKSPGSNQVGASYEMKFVSKADSKTMLVFIATEMTNVVSMIATSAVVRDMSNSSYACALFSSFSYKERVLAKSLSVYLVNSIDYIRTDGSVTKIRSEKLLIRIHDTSDIRTRKRQKIEIMSDILHFIRSSDCKGITSIIYRCNLNYNTALKMIDELIKKDYLKVKETDDKKTYIVTEKGRLFLETVANFKI